METEVLIQERWEVREVPQGTISRVISELVEGGMTQTSLATRLGLRHKGTISDAKSGKQQLDDKHLAKLAAIYSERTGKRVSGSDLKAMKYLEKLEEDSGLTADEVLAARRLWIKAQKKKA